VAEAALPNPIKQSQIETGLSPRASAPAFKSPIDIIRTSAQKENPGVNADLILKQVAMLVQSKKIKLLQLGNTVFLIYPQPDGVAEIHTFTIEGPQELAQRYKAGANSLKQMGFKKAVSYATSPAFVRIAQQTGLPVQIKQDLQRIGGKARKAYKFEVTL
jgi:hypothetical protein